VPTNVTLTSATSVVRIPPSFSVIHGEKTEKFIGLNFKWWKNKKLFYLTTLNLAKFLTEEAPKSSQNKSDPTIMVTVDAWNHIDFTCKNYILNELDNILYNV